MRAAKLQIQLRREGLCHWVLWFEGRLRMSGTPSGLKGRILNKQTAPGRAASLVVLPGANLCHFTHYKQSNENSERKPIHSLPITANRIARRRRQWLVACLTASGRFKKRSMSSCVARRCASELAVALSIAFRLRRADVASARTSGEAFSLPARSIKRCSGQALHRPLDRAVVGVLRRQASSMSRR